VEVLMEGSVQGSTSHEDLLAAIPDDEVCERCDGEGSYSELAPCTTFGPDCACNGPRVIVDHCPDCDGSGMRSDV
jgi:DnaJ-class molecular chaperone